VKPLALLSVLRIALAIQGFLCFHINFRIGISVSVKNDLEFLWGLD
jgi:hypothetical protein